ncbi:sugar phosphate isomerase/epimerase [Arenibacter sp. F26102]|uniref:TIM barrel protein n=1 Tax=Arenibacter sp. F26102 TaxID=2926416 RepID=UPI001FF63A09|nr:TIM barrel protein [Arenibacter sp. F26102]MCK0144559.1 sugar phosphate isomerase/epimerase [Arenibacter sp. F26102]
MDFIPSQEYLEFINAVGSPNVQVYYNVADSNKMGYNIYEEILWLGKKHICEFHAQENGYLLGQGRIDFEEIKKAIDDIDYEGLV